MKLTRGKRIAIELFGPPMMGVIIVLTIAEGHALWDFTQGNHRWLGHGRFLKDIWILFLIAYVFAGLQSIVYTLVMEWRFSAGLDPRGWRAVVWSTALGFLSGAAIVAFYGWGRTDTLDGWLYFGGLGTVVGCGMGLLVKLLSPTGPGGD
jgi:hypothetical protein